MTVPRAQNKTGSKNIEKKNNVIRVLRELRFVLRHKILFYAKNEN